MKSTQDEIVRDLLGAALGYGRAGLALFRGTGGLYRNSQAAIGNLAIATELLLKAYIAKQNLQLLLKDLPLELKCVLSAQQSLPASFRKAPYKIELRSSGFKTIELDEAIAIFSVFFPDLKAQLGAHLRFLSRCRNQCVHAGLPDFREYEVQRTVFLFLTLYQHLKKEQPDLLKYSHLGNTEENDAFLRQFDEQRLARVHDAIEKAREKAKHADEQSLYGSVDGWELCVAECPICGADAVLSGDTQDETEFDDERMPSLVLMFVGYSFECDVCGLKLEDYAEIEMAGIDPVVDRSDEADKWVRQHYEEHDPW